MSLGLCRGVHSDSKMLLWHGLWKLEITMWRHLTLHSKGWHLLLGLEHVHVYEVLVVYLVWLEEVASRAQCKMLEHEGSKF